MIQIRGHLWASEGEWAIIAKLPFLPSTSLHELWLKGCDWLFLTKILEGLQLLNGHFLQGFLCNETLKGLLSFLKMAQSPHLLMRVTLILVHVNMIFENR